MLWHPRRPRIALKPSLEAFRLSRTVEPHPRLLLLLLLLLFQHPQVSRLSWLFIPSSYCPEKPLSPLLIWHCFLTFFFALLFAVVVGNDAFFTKFYFSDSGVLYENPVLQIGVKCEYHNRIGRVALFYGNRGAAPLTNVTSRVTHSAAPGALSFKYQPVAASVNPGVQEQQTISVECHSPFVEPPVLEVDLA
jgi:hypothetical protein